MENSKSKLLFQSKDSTLVDPNLTLGRLDKTILKKIESYLDPESKSSFKQVMKLDTKEKDMQNFISMMAQLNPNEEEEEEEEDEISKLLQMNKFLKMTRAIKYDDILGSISKIKSINDIREHLIVMNSEKIKNILRRNLIYLNKEPSKISSLLSNKGLFKIYMDEGLDEELGKPFLKIQDKLSKFNDNLDQYHRVDDFQKLLEKYRKLVEQNFFLLDQVMNSVKVKHIIDRMTNLNDYLNKLSESNAKNFTTLFKKAQIFNKLKGLKTPIKVSLSSYFSDDFFEDFLRKINKGQIDKQSINEKLNSMVIPSFAKSVYEWIKNTIQKIKIVLKDVLPYLQQENFDIINKHLKDLDQLEMLMSEEILQIMKEDGKLTIDKIFDVVGILSLDLQAISNASFK